MRFVPSYAKNVLFAKMDELRDHHTNLNAWQLTEELQTGKGNYYFSFSTKMLNLLENRVYSIYDSQLGTVFQGGFIPDESCLDYQETIYQDILDTYRNLEDRNDAE